MSPFSRKSLDPHNLLEKTAYWPFRFARIFGVWPFALQNRLLIFRWGSPGTVLSILNLSIYITCYCLVGKNKHTIILRRLENPSTTHLDLVGQSAIANLKTFCVIFLYLSCLLNRHNFVRVWNNISRITTALANASQFCHLSSPALAQCEARNMKRQKYLTMYVLVLSLVHAAIEVAPISENLAHHLKPSTAAQLSLVFFTWSFYSNMYAFFVAMLVGMVQTVEDCFAILSLSLHTLTAAESKPGTSPAVMVSNQNKPWDAKRVRHIIKFGQDLETAVEEMNGRLKPQLLFVIAMMVFILTVGAFFAAKTIQSRLVNVDYFGTLVMVFLSYSIFHMFCRRCGGLITQAQNYGKCLGMVLCRNFDSDVMAMIQVEANRFILKPPTVSPGQFFTIRTELISSVIALLATYSVVLFQFDQEGGRGTMTPIRLHPNNGTTSN